MTTPLPVVVVNPQSKLGFIVAHGPEYRSFLSLIFSHEAARICPTWVKPTFEIVVTPTNCKHGLREDWCAFCKKQNTMGIVDARNTSNSYKERTQFKKDLARTVVNFPCAADPNSTLSETIREAMKRPEARTISATDLNSLRTSEVHAAHFEPARCLNYCPRCWVARAQRVQITPCLDCKGLSKLDEVEAMHARKRALKFEDYCAKWQAKYAVKRLAQMREIKCYRYSPEEFDREILSSRGTVCADAVRQFDKDISRKGNKYRIQ